LSAAPIENTSQAKQSANNNGSEASFMTDKTIQTDVAVIGGGPGGYTAAFLAADKGKQVTLIDAGSQLGGVCLNCGCIPSKTLLHVADLIRETDAYNQRGISFNSPEIDIDKLREWKQSVIDRNAKGLAQLAKARKVKTVRGYARFKDANTLQLESVADDSDTPETIEAAQIIIATGSRPVIPKPLQLESDRVWTSTRALDLPQIPEKLLVVGGGYIGLEIGTCYAAFGSKVTVVEMTDSLLPGNDPELVKVLQKTARKTFDAIHLETQVDSLEETDRGLKVTIAKGDEKDTLEVDCVLLATGRQPVSDNLDLSNTGIEVTDDGFIKVDKSCRTAEDNIYAIGDVAGQPLLAHKASHQARIAVEQMLGNSPEDQERTIPAVVFTDPEIAYAGLSESQAEEEGIEVKVTRFPWAASGRAASIGRTDGLTKLIARADDNTLVGIGIAGVNAGELISEGVVAIDAGLTAESLSKSIHPHPTLSETIGEAAELFSGPATHVYKKPRG
jgi:dihydrolipoamide dehydrogenase